MNISTNGQKENVMDPPYHRKALLGDQTRSPECNSKTVGITLLYRLTLETVTSLQLRFVV